VRHELKAQEGRGCSVRGLPTLHPDTRHKKMWDLVFAMLLVFVCFKEPLQIGFPKVFDARKASWDTFDLVADIFFFIDMFFSSVTGYFSADGQLISSQPNVVMHYVRTWFTVDLLSTLPFHRIINSQDVDQHVLRLSKFIRLLKLFKLIRLVRSSQALSRRIVQSQLAYIAHPALIRLLNLCCGLVLTWHCIGCIWWFLRSNELQYQSGATDVASLGFILNEDGANTTSTPGELYIEAYYWAVSVTAGIGVPVLPASHPEAIFDGFVTFLGILLQAYMLGSASSALHTMDALKAAQQRKLDTVKQYMRSKRVPPVRLPTLTTTPLTLLPGRPSA
jgi:hypothetical protein